MHTSIVWGEKKRGKEREEDRDHRHCSRMSMKEKEREGEEREREMQQNDKPFMRMVSTLNKMKIQNIFEKIDFLKNVFKR